jgi:endoglucanase
VHHVRRLLVASLTLAMLVAGAANAESVPRLPVPHAQSAGFGACRSGWQPAGLDPRGVAPSAANPLAGTTWYVDPFEHAWHYWRAYSRRGKQRDSALMWKIASQPKFRWFGRWTRHGPALVKKIRAYLDQAACSQPGAIPLMAVMRAQSKKCHHGYLGGGRAEDRRTRVWYRRFARAVGSRRVVIAFEPDSLGTIDCLAKRRRSARYKLLRYGVKVLSKLPNATIYLEAGASDWEPARRTAKQLRMIGISRVRGFMLNVTHYDWTASNIQHGLDISRRVGGKHFIVSTSYNGRGPVHYRRYSGLHRWRTINVWCHPLMRGLGPAPSTDTARPDKVDAYMWIGRPGYSGGACNGGPLPVGAWWAGRALMFAKFATNWVRPPRGTRYGHYRHFSLHALGG